jgi:ABC-type branched-subunit amino acid transport system substrate-binding protein
MATCRSYLGAATLLVSLVSCAKSDWHAPPPDPENLKLTIEVFSAASDSEEGYSAIREAALLAKDTEEFKKAATYVTLDLQNDPDNLEDAARIAQKTSLNPGVLAIIGHSRSGTTRVAMPFYAQAGIPVLMPTATSPYVLFRFDEHDGWPSVPQLREGNTYHRFTNAFRLRPSDVPDQVHAMKLTLNKLEALNKRAGSPKPKVVLICDTTSRNGSDVYTKPMCDALLNDSELSSKITSYRPFSLDSDIYGLVTEIHAAKPNYIVILGYPELARDVLEELTERMQPREKRLPYKFILPDASLQNYLTKFSSDIYVTSSFNGGQAKGCNKKLIDALSQKKPQRVVLTDESYTFDAVLILARAVNSCDGQVNRSCVMRFIKEHHDDLVGACETYFVDRGERQNAAFNVNSVCGGTFKVRWLARKDGDELEDSPKWCNQGDR